MKTPGYAGAPGVAGAPGSGGAWGVAGNSIGGSWSQGGTWSGVAGSGIGGYTARSTCKRLCGEQNFECPSMGAVESCLKDCEYRLSAGQPCVDQQYVFDECAIRALQANFFGCGDLQSALQMFCYVEQASLTSCLANQSPCGTFGSASEDECFMMEDCAPYRTTLLQCVRAPDTGVLTCQCFKNGLVSFQVETLEPVRLACAESNWTACIQR